MARDLAFVVAIGRQNRNVVAREPGVERGEDAAERVPYVAAAARRRDVQDSHSLAVEGAAPDRPVESILERSRDAERIFRHREQHRIGTLEHAPEVPDRRRSVRLAVGIEHRQLRETLVDDDVDAAVGGPSCDRAQCGRVHGRTSQASRDRDDLHGGEPAGRG